MSYHQKIECNVSSCAHNCLEDCTCRLDRIKVRPCVGDVTRTSDGETYCDSYFYVGEMNIAERLGRGDPAGSDQR